MTLYLRLFAGFTSLISARCLSHFFSIGPPGIWLLSSMRFPLPDPAREDGHGHRDVADHDREGEDGGERAAVRVHVRVVEPDRLRRAVDAVIEVQAERQHRDD